MGNTHSRNSPPLHEAPQKNHSRLLFNLLPLPPLRLPHLRPSLQSRLHRHKGTYNTTTTLHSLAQLRNIIAVTTTMLKTYRTLSPERNPALRARFLRFLSRAEDFYVRGCEECIRYNKTTGWYDVDHGRVARGVDRIVSGYLALAEEVGEGSYGGRMVVAEREWRRGSVGRFRGDGRADTM